MNKTDIVEIVYNNMKLPKQNCIDFVELFFETMKDSLAAGDCLKINGFGNFKILERKERKGRSLQTGEAITLNARRVISFKPSEILMDAINK